MIKRALISVYDKGGIAGFAKGLADLGIRIISTGGTAKVLKDSGIDVVEISDITKFPEAFDGRVKTLHPLIHGGILAVRDNQEHESQMEQHSMDFIDMVVVNLYPFGEVIAKEHTLSDAVENIDIGGPALIRSAAKNHRDVVVACDPADYENILDNLKIKGDIELNLRQHLAVKAFSHTAGYDMLIHNYFDSVFKYDNNFNDNKKFKLPGKLFLRCDKIKDMRYGENPHQRGALYRINDMHIKGSTADAKKLHGKELSFNRAGLPEGLRLRSDVSIRRDYGL